MEQIGEFVVLAYHDVRDAASLHGHFKRRGIDAAVIDAAYIISRLHLAVALHRITRRVFTMDSNKENNKENNKTIISGGVGQKSSPTARDVFAALSHTRNLDRVLRSLTCSETTTAVVIVLCAPSAEHIAGVVSTVSGVQHELSALPTYTKEAAVREFYGVNSSETSLVTTTATRREIGGEMAGLEVTVVNRLATNDI
ncbi:uncharacterized protein TM35_000152490 [Trypanosoma theileri]|uniref:Kinase binding protein CGI-121 n=1 Tax=Trypanosoma theileri TaxID=67003 RepID=A0A1X0NWA1_9TRYP|nr:uncharacterized protein TM35_000152490 [Trypanosoma theileri]ORC88818.1 hypothetical protein TM35_000152490 [Trypanosoma theileri]